MVAEITYSTQWILFVACVDTESCYQSQSLPPNLSSEHCIFQAFDASHRLMKLFKRMNLYIVTVTTDNYKHHDVNYQLSFFINMKLNLSSPLHTNTLKCLYSSFCREFQHNGMPCQNFGGRKLSHCTTCFSDSTQLTLACCISDKTWNKWSTHVELDI